MKRFKCFFALAAFVLTVVFVFPVIAFADDIFSTGGTVSPEKDIYYVGDTVNITDRFRNKDTADATSVSVEYYYRLDGGSSVYSGTPIVFGTIAGGTSESHSYTHTFKEEDVGEYRIGSKITYMISGGGPYQEFSSGHDFIVMPAPTPTPTPTASSTPNTPSPTPTAEPTAEPSATAAPEDEATGLPTPIPTFTPKPETSETRSNDDELASIFKDNMVLTVSIIVLSVVLAALIILIIVISAKKR